MNDEPAYKPAAALFFQNIALTGGGAIRYRES
jgi:predicted outer membrane repeat protein